MKIVSLLNLLTQFPGDSEVGIQVPSLKDGEPGPSVAVVVDGYVVGWIEATFED